MEYVGTTSGTTSADGKLVANISSTGYTAATDALNIVNKVPLFTMPQAQFNMLRTWYGKGGATTTSTFGDWFSPYQNSVLRAKSAALSGIVGQ
jgi:hypothetical protein